jgi:hypothetical protein
MPKNGWSHLVVTITPPGTFLATDGGTFADEQEMLRELGATGWELILIREAAGGALVYYFKRPRT